MAFTAATGIDKRVRLLAAAAYLRSAPGICSCKDNYWCDLKL